MDNFLPKEVPIRPDILKLVLVSAVVMGLSYTLSYERIFAPLRSKLGGKDTWLGYLVCCPYCNSHWLAFALVPLTGTYFGSMLPPWGMAGALLDWFLSSILVTVVAAFLRVVFFWMDEFQGLVRRRQRETEEEVATQRILRARTAHELEQELEREQWERRPHPRIPEELIHPETEERH